MLQKGVGRKLTSPQMEHQKEPGLVQKSKQTAKELVASYQSSHQRPLVLVRARKLQTQAKDQLHMLRVTQSLVKWFLKQSRERTVLHRQTRTGRVRSPASRKPVVRARIPPLPLPQGRRGVGGRILGLQRPGKNNVREGKERKLPQLTSTRHRPVR